MFGTRSHTAPISAATSTTTVITTMAPAITTTTTTTTGAMVPPRFSSVGSVSSISSVSSRAIAKSTSRRAPIYMAIAFGLAALALILYIEAIADPTIENEPSSTLSTVGDDEKGSGLVSSSAKGSSAGTAIGTSKSTVTITMGTTPSTRIDYYHCSNSSSSAGGSSSSKKKDRDTFVSSVDLVLLHGARFTKEDWKSSGLLSRFCHLAGMTAIALDLPVSASGEDLREVLTELREEQRIGAVTEPSASSSSRTSATPTLALVTPSASGKTMASWLAEKNSAGGSLAPIESVLTHWIPVAPPALNKVPRALMKDQLAGKIHVLAVYGHKDIMGRSVSERIQESTEGELVEIAGTHPCYLDSPDAFVEAVAKFLGL